MLGPFSTWRNGVDEWNIWKIASRESTGQRSTTECRSWLASPAVRDAMRTSAAKDLAMDWSDSCDAMDATPTNYAPL